VLVEVAGSILESKKKRGPLVVLDVGGGGGEVVRRLSEALGKGRLEGVIIDPVGGSPPNQFEMRREVFGLTSCAGEEGHYDLVLFCHCLYGGTSAEGLVSRGVELLAPGTSRLVVAQRRKGHETASKLKSWVVIPKTFVTSISTLEARLNARDVLSDDRRLSILLGT
jgi:hypothetical protein